MDPNSPNALAKVSNPPEIAKEDRAGSRTLQKVCHCEAQKMYRFLWPMSTSFSTGCTARTVKGNVTNNRAKTMAGQAKTILHRIRRTIH